MQLNWPTLTSQPASHSMGDGMVSYIQNKNKETTHKWVGGEEENF